MRVLIYSVDVYPNNVCTYRLMHHIPKCIELSLTRALFFFFLGEENTTRTFHCFAGISSVEKGIHLGLVFFVFLEYLLFQLTTTLKTHYKIIWEWDPKCLEHHVHCAYIIYELDYYVNL